MTAQKFKLYFPAWAAAVKANGWHMQDCRLQIADCRLSDEGRKMVAFARQRAVTAGRGPVVDDLRRGAHVVALGRDKSSKVLTNAELDRVLTLFRLLTDPEDLSVRLDWDAYQRGEDPGAFRRLHWVIQSVPEAIARKIAVDMIHTRNWENAPIADKRTLARRLAQYRDSKRERAAGILPAEPELDPANAPF